MGLRLQRGHARTRTAGLFCVVLASAALLSVPATVRANTPSAGDPSPDSRTPAASTTTVTVSSPGDTAWPEALEAITFELDQAGYTVGTSPDGEPGSVVVEIERTETQWHLRCSGDGIFVQERGSVSDGPELVAMLAVELVVASRVQPPVALPHRSGVEEPVARPVHPVRPTATLRAETPREPVISRQWAGELGATAGTLGPVGAVGVEAGLRHHWARAELALTAAAGQLQASEANETIDGSSSSLELRAFARAGLAAFYVFRPGRRVRPSLGAKNSLLLPVVRSAGTERSSADPQTWVRTQMTSTGVLWVPSGHAGLRVGLQPRLAWQLSLFAGPAISIRRPELASGGTFVSAGWTAGLTTGFMFGNGLSRQP